ncbi:hypothetical protein IU414_27390 [Nocardia farcinica]|uniref:hypothetical protein n=1 Tax=Nocardia TaxID=1817 RepID=UPI000303492C|nr:MULTISPECIES: hypothetical protein [Nocardia]MBF6588472.1 hypothetical protein [Nocardia farcinica]
MSIIRRSADIDTDAEQQETASTDTGENTTDASKIVVFAGSGVGKTGLIAQLAAEAHERGESVELRDLAQAEHDETAPVLTTDSDDTTTLTVATGDSSAAHDADPAHEATDAQVPPLFHIMAAEPGSGATTLAAWCACAEEVPRDMRWRPEPGHSPYLVLTASKTAEGVRVARQLAGALSRTVGGRVQIAAIALLEDQPRPTLALRELIAAAERAGIPIHTIAHDPRMRMPRDDEHERLWTPQNAETATVPPVLDDIYRRVFHTIADKETTR